MIYVGCPPSLTLPHLGGGKCLCNKVGASGQGASLPPLWGRAGVGGRVREGGQPT